ncbi:Up-regulated during septation-domain-containing protein, partial [Russula brevipes]
VLSSRVGALQKKLATEAKIRDAAQTLARLNSSPSSPARISRQSSSALETAERKLQAAQTELWRVQERAANIGQRLLEHRAGVLGAALAEAERTQAKGHTDTNGSHSPILSPSTTMAVATPRFDGAHLFAGHEDALVPGRPSHGAPPRGGSANQIELEDLEARLAAAEARVQQQEAELEGARMTATSELEVARAEAAADLAGVQAASASELARAQERVAALEGRWNAERAMWEAERSIFEQEKQQWEGLTETLENERAMWEQEREELTAQAKDQIADAAEGLRILVQRFDIPLFSRGSGLDPGPSSPLTFAKDAAGFVTILQPLWATLPSPEARAARLSNAARPFRAGGGRTSPSQRAGAGSPGPSGVSISDMDVRALKSLYAPGGSGSGAGAGTPGSPIDNVGVFSVEAFAQRVQALISDDRALMERLIRFAQAHDLLKKNAERAQKLAQESNAALETYQRQVHTLEEHLARTDGLYVEQLAAEKVAMERRVAEQTAEQRQLKDANTALSARALQLAQEASAVKEELRAANTVSEREGEQRLALLEEINLVQTENGNLRQQLRALGKL